MKHKILNNIIDDIKKLEHLMITDTIDKQILNDLLKQLKILQETTSVSNTTDKIDKIYLSLKIPMRTLFDNYKTSIQKESMNYNPHYIKVVLDKNADIVEFDCTLKDTQSQLLNKQIGKNWIDTFIDISDRDEILKVFNGLLQNQTEEWETYENDIKCIDGTHKRIDFINEVIIKDDEKFISSFGVELLKK